VAGLPRDGVLSDMSRLQILLDRAIDECKALNSFMPSLLSNLEHTGRTAESLGRTVDRELGTLRAQVRSLTGVATTAEAKLAERAQEASESLDDLGDAAGELGRSITGAVAAVAEGATSLEHSGAGAQEDLDAQLPMVDSALASAHGAAEGLSELLADARGDVGAQLSLQILDEAIDGLKFGQDMWEQAQRLLYEAIGQQALEVARSLAHAADGHAQELVAVVNGLIDDCNAAALSVYQSLMNGVPHRSAEAYGELGETMEELTEATKGREAQVADLEQRAAEKEAAIESAFASVGADLAATAEAGR
jgi:hypothetical protein